tara:strand:+ start:6833 stop:7288 length:456 start_codon:yes stop_codon:yes gene_type:complete
MIAATKVTTPTIATTVMIDRVVTALMAVRHLTPHHPAILDVAPTLSTMAVAAVATQTTTVAVALKVVSSNSSSRNSTKARAEVSAITRSNTSNQQLPYNATHNVHDAHRNLSMNDQSIFSARQHRPQCVTHLMRQREATRMLWPEMLSPGS